MVDAIPSGRHTYTHTHTRPIATRFITTVRSVLAWTWHADVAVRLAVFAVVSSAWRKSSDCTENDRQETKTWKAKNV